MAESTEKKTIQINPDLFQVSGNNTRKNRKPRQTKNPIKVKAPPKPKNNSTLKKNLLKMIRNHQQQSNHSKSSLIPSSIETNETSVPKSEFEQSLQFLTQVNEKSQEKKEKKLKKVKNQTIRNVIPIHPPTTSHNHVEKPELIAAMPPRIHLDNMPLPSVQEPPVQIVAPQPYGCLKNGNLPTYRMWKNQTQKVLPQQTIPKPPKPIIEIQPSTSMEQYEQQLNDRIQTLSKMEQMQSKNNPVSCAPKKPRKQKRILRRTFRVGKSKKFPRVSVLVSNKTIRNNTNLKTIDLQQAPIKDVKKYLLNQGLIKVGTSTPNNVLRQMYESAKLLPGEVKNHNPENLLYNYFNTEDEL